MTEYTWGALFCIFLGLVLWFYAIWDIKARKIHRLVPVKDWKFIRYTLNFGQPRREVLTPENHPYIFLFEIAKSIFLGFISIIGGILVVLYS